MTEKKVFCVECRDDVSYNTSIVQMTGKIKGEEYTYEGKAAHCDNCGSEIYVDEVNDFNLKMLYDEYRSANGIVSLDTVLKIPEKYAIGKRPLSLLLGWGELTFSRYCDGDVPTKQYSDIIQKIYNEPEYYSELLESNKDRLKTDSAYRKSKKAVDTLLGLYKKDKTKIEYVVEYMLNKCEDITPLMLQKALYYVQGFYYAFNKEYLFTEDCEAWAHGPVYREIYYKYQNYRFNPIDVKTDIDVSDYTSSEISILENVVKHICCYSGKILEEFTHSETPWLEVRGNLPDNAPSDRIISKEKIGKYFSCVKDKFNMLSPKEIKAYSQTMFQQI